MKYKKRLQQKRNYRKFQELWKSKVTGSTSWLNLPDPGISEGRKRVKRFANADGSVNMVLVNKALQCVGLRRCAALDFMRSRQ